jgi:hypothetical protein
MNLPPAKMAVAFGLGLISLGTFLYWYDPVLFPGMAPFGLPMFHGALPAPTKFYFGLSYGVAILFGLALAWIGWEMHRPVAIAWAAFVLLLIALNCPLQIGFSQPGWLDQFLQARDNNLAIAAFGNNTDSPLEILAPPIPSEKLTDIDGLYDRWYASVVALQIGWWFFLAGALLFAGAALSFVPAGVVRRRYLVRAAIVFLLFLVFHGLGPTLGELCWDVGQRAEFGGHRDAAETWYRRALTLDEWNRRVPRVYARLGALAEAAHRVHSPEYHFYMGQRHMHQNDLNEALDEYSQAMTAAGPDLRRVTGNAYSQAAFAAANILYHTGPSSGDVPVKLDMVSPDAALAAFYWQKAAQATESNLADTFMAARAFQDAGQYDRAAALLTQARGKAADPMILSNFFDAQGDVDYLRGDVSAARLDYLRAYALLNHNKDYWSVRSAKNLTDNATPP